MEDVETIGLFASSHSPLVPFAIGGNSAFVEITDNGKLVSLQSIFTLHNIATLILYDGSMCVCVCVCLCVEFF